MATDLGSKKVAVIDDDKLSAHNLGVKLRFMGEEHVLLSGAGWRDWFADPARRDQVYVLLAGNLNATTPARILAGLAELGAPHPVILTGEEAQLDALTPEQRERVLDVLARPLPYERLTACLARARRQGGLPVPKGFQSRLISETGTAMFRSLVGRSEGIGQVRDLIAQVAGRDVTVLVTGESGTGKEIVARNLHHSSGRGTGPFAAVNAAALTVESLDPAFHRRERGEAPSADCAPGHFDRARGGTLFIDLVDEMPSDVQAILLRYLESSAARDGHGGPASGGSDGGQAEEGPPARLVVAARGSLQEKVRAGQFREDLYYRLNVFPIQVPPLRERSEDIPDLLDELSARLEGRGGVAVRFNSAACLSLRRHPWPGNVRELANLVERLSIILPGEVVGLSDLPANYQHISEEEFARMESQALGEAPADGASVDEQEGINAAATVTPPDRLTAESVRRYLGNFEKQLLEVALENCDWDIAGTAEHLQTSAAQLDQMMKKHGLKARV